MYSSHKGALVSQLQAGRHDTPLSGKYTSAFVVLVPTIGQVQGTVNKSSQEMWKVWKMTVVINLKPIMSLQEAKGITPEAW